MSDRYLVTPGGTLHGTLRMPGDKSISHRALMLAAVAEGTTHISGLLESEDCLATANAVAALGADVRSLGDGAWQVAGVGAGGFRAADGPLDLGNSGTGLRLLMGLLCGQQVAATLVGDESLMQRPMERVAVPLRAMGAEVTTRDGCPPVVLTPRHALHGAAIAPPVASAQVKSAVLLAGLGANGTTSVTESRATRDHTETLLPAFGCPVHQDGLTCSIVGPVALTATAIQVPGDPSSAAFFAVAASLVPGSEILIEGVGVNPRRAGFIDILQRMGADIELLRPRRVGEEPVADLRVRHAPLTGVEIVAADVPAAIDELPVLLVAAAAASGPSRLSGAEELRVKESDRLARVEQGLVALGVACEARSDGLDLAGGASFCGGVVDSAGDHRIAMAFAVAGLIATAPVEILDTRNVATSFPGFVPLARSAGWSLTQGPGCANE